MRPLVAGLAVCLAVIVGCGEDEVPLPDASDSGVGPTAATTPTDQIATPSPSPISSPIPLPAAVGLEPEGFDKFRIFSGGVSGAIDASDPDFFVSRAIEVQLVCLGDEQLGPCADAPAGTVRRGIPGSAWKSDAWAIFPKEDYTANLLRYFDAPIDEAQDGYGTGELRLFALAAREDEGAITFMAIASAIVDVYPSTGYPIGHQEREAHVFDFEYLGKGWGFVGERAAVVSFTAADWLSGICAECYDYWELWQGATE